MYIYVCIMNLTNLTVVKLVINITHYYSILYVYKILIDIHYNYIMSISIV